MNAEQQCEYFQFGQFHLQFCFPPFTSLRKVAEETRKWLTNENYPFPYLDSDTLGYRMLMSLRTELFDQLQG